MQIIITNLENGCYAIEIGIAEYIIFLMLLVTI